MTGQAVMQKIINNEVCDATGREAEGCYQRRVDDFLFVLFFAEHPKMFYSSYHSDLPMITICNLLMNNKSNFSYI